MTTENSNSSDATTGVNAQTAAGEQSAPEEKASESAAEKLFTQEELNKKISERLAREREKASEAAAAANRTAEERIAALESANREIARRALVGEIAAAHGISSEDAALFLTAADEDGLKAQATRLAGLAEAKRRAGGIVPTEGTVFGTVKPSTEREFARRLFGE